MSAIFFDCEFTGLHKNTSLISIGLIADNGQKFYAEITDFDRNQIDNWLQANVIDNLILLNEGSKIKNGVNINGRLSLYDFYIKDTAKNVSIELRKWLNQYKTIEWVSDVCHYDFVLLIDLVYGHALAMPYGKHNAACHDINQDIAKYYNISEIEAFDKSREEILEEHGVTIEGKKHNALYDAEVIKAIYDIMNKPKMLGQLIIDAVNNNFKIKIEGEDNERDSDN